MERQSYFQDMAREWLGTARLSRLEADALNEAAGDAELFRIAYKLVHISQAARVARHPQLANITKEVDAMLRKIGGGYFDPPADVAVVGRLSKERALYHDFADFILTQALSVHTIDVSRAVKFLQDQDAKERDAEQTFANYATEFNDKVVELLSAKEPFYTNPKTGRRDQYSKHIIAKLCGWEKSTADARFNHPKYCHMFAPALARLQNAPKPPSKRSDRGCRTT